MVAEGLARTRLETCTDKHWDAVSWRKMPGGVDSSDPGPAKRCRPTLGMPILLGMSPASDPNAWEGEIYNSHNGKTYSARMVLRQPDVLRVEGCLIGRFLFGGQN